MALGLGYDSDEGRAWAGAITALMTGHAYATSARAASRMGPFAGYLDRWGLAGGGLWLVFFALVGLALVASSSGRAASWPVGLPAVVAAGLLVGLLWPYLLGGFGRSIGVLVDFVGAIVLVVGGVLDQRARHDRPESGVSEVDGKGR